MSPGDWARLLPHRAKKSGRVTGMAWAAGYRCASPSTREAVVYVSSDEWSVRHARRKMHNSTLRREEDGSRERKEWAFHSSLLVDFPRDKGAERKKRDGLTLIFVF